MDTPPASAPARKPWPMTWIVVVIAIYIAGYTFINIAYRKPGDAAHEPYADAQERSRRTVQTTMEGWSRVAAGYTGTGGEAFPESAAISRQPLPERLDRALPRELPLIMPGKPALHPAAISLAAPATVAASDSLRVRLDFPDGAAVPGFGEILAYFKDQHLYLFIQDHRHVARDTRPTPATPPLHLVLAPATLTPGTWQASAFTATESFSWSFTVE